MPVRGVADAPGADELGPDELGPDELGPDELAPDITGFGFTAALPVAPALAGASAFAAIESLTTGEGGTALEPVAPGFNGSPDGDEPEGLFDFSADVEADENDGDAFGAVWVALGAVALLPVGPALAGAALGTALLSSGLALVAALPALSSTLVALEPSALLPVAPGLAGAEPGTA